MLMQVQWWRVLVMMIDPLHLQARYRIRQQYFDSIKAPKRLLLRGIIESSHLWHADR